MIDVRAVQVRGGAVGNGQQLLNAGSFFLSVARYGRIAPGALP